MATIPSQGVSSTICTVYTNSKQTRGMTFFRKPDQSIFAERFQVVGGVEQTKCGTIPADKIKVRYSSKSGHFVDISISELDPLEQDQAIRQIAESIVKVNEGGEKVCYLSPSTADSDH